VPSGIWHPDEYAKLPAYDADTGQQPTQVFLCHQHDAGSDRSRVCAGWAGCHDGTHLLAMRFAAITGSMSPQAVDATMDYCSPVPLFRSGAEAAEHGMAEVERPGSQAVMAMGKIARRRADLIIEEG
jgi:hypothetical protein